MRTTRPPDPGASGRFEPAPLAALAPRPAHGAAPSEVSTARALLAAAGRGLSASPSFVALPHATQQAILRDVSTLENALGGNRAAGRAEARALETPNDLARRRLAARGGEAGSGGTTEGAVQGSEEERSAGSTTKPPATEVLAKRVGALSDEIDFPAFVASLVHGTFDAIVDASIRQMEAFADLVSAVAHSVEQFTSENVTPNQARDDLARKHPRDLLLEVGTGPDAAEPRLLPRSSGDDEEASSPSWLADYGLADEALTAELVEEQLVPAARRRIGESRLQMLATMVLLGMNRIVVRDGSISAKVRFRAAARDTGDVTFATSNDPGPGTWGERGSSTYASATTMVSTVGVNAQTDIDLKVELFGEVRINFASETLPLERFADSARVALLQRNARWTNPTPATSAPAATAPAPALPPPAAPPSAPPPVSAPPAAGGGR
jgi:hypothetical protein